MKIGDRVRVHSYSDFWNGSIGTVLRENRNGWVIAIKKGEGSPWVNTSFRGRDVVDAIFGIGNLEYAFCRKSKEVK